jgi:hypothetical protein
MPLSDNLKLQESLADDYFVATLKGLPFSG